ncbi:hypothetical protein GSI_00159 [Ganoderma sinense ZZ0214-1]|uniref:Uncharacterized protein n=1 Tax=Ganoderma sinense ZZ0214-1 TaxID=1077348 RepID=A0A2G8SRT6_9APHY|nr:hypothetical protein GSI_00159 [Ganoderma sinense ZZ0214-1]
MAAALSLSLLSHTLFLKSQVPFPVAQLSRMPVGKSNPKVAKKRDELLATFDILSSHLQTTFVALSTAYAKCKSAKTKAETATSDENGHFHVQPNSVAGPSRGTAHLMFVLGPSANSARARIVLTIDGLDIKVWGTRPYEFLARDEVDDDMEGESDSEEDSEEFEDCCEGEDSEEEEEEERSGSEEDASEDEGARDDASSDSGSSPPSSRSPSPSPPKRSLAPSPESLPSPFVPATPLPVKPTPFTFVHPLPSSSTDPVAAREFQTTPKPPESSQASSKSNPRAASVPPSPHEASPAPPELSYAEEQLAVRAAERLLSRTLMNAWVDGEGDMSSELAPTQTHLFLRAPRRFMHPAWAARQNLSRTLDGVLDGFLEDAGAVAPSTSAGKSKTKMKGVRTEGAWIGCKSGSAYAEMEKERPVSSVEPVVSNVDDGNVEDEEDEEIWWVWDGKIVGFADW